MTADMCKGQAMDLDSKGKQLTLEQLNMMCFYKTGIAFEASLIMPAILAHAKELEMEALKKFAHHAGIAFQIKDDLLDVEGDLILLGKPIGKDAENNNSTFVSILGAGWCQKRDVGTLLSCDGSIARSATKYHFFEAFIELYCEPGSLSF